MPEQRPQPPFCRTIRVSARSDPAANSRFARASKASGPLVVTPVERRLSIRSRTDSRSPIDSFVCSIPRTSRTTTPAGTSRAASGISWVTTRSPGAACWAMWSSAPSGPLSTRHRIARSTYPWSSGLPPGAGGRAIPSRRDPGRGVPVRKGPQKIRAACAGVSRKARSFRPDARKGGPLGRIRPCEL